jgi:membrane-associated phospholipid phosphatase
MTAGQRRAVSAMWSIALLGAVLAAAGYMALDGLVLQSAPRADAASFWARGVALLDGAALRDTWDFLLPSALVLAGVLLLALRATRATGFGVLYVGLVQILSYAAAHLSTPWFGRVRPSEALAGGDVWFAAGNSFPSGHTAFYAGLFLPLVVLFPRLAPVWLVPPLFVATAGVLGQDHYLSDVSTSIALAAILSAALCFIAAKAAE